MRGGVWGEGAIFPLAIRRANPEFRAAPQLTESLEQAFVKPMTIPVFINDVDA